MGVARELIVHEDQVLEELFCPTCNDLLNPDDASQTPCGHLFCRKCIEATIASRNKGCPVCHRHMKGVQAMHVCNAPLCRILKKTLVKCANHQRGCGWVGQLAEAGIHRNGCDFGTQHCANCNVDYKREDAQKHEICGVIRERNALQEKLREVRSELVNLQKEAGFQKGGATDPSIYRYDRERVLKLGQCIAANLAARPPLVDQTRIFSVIRKYAEDLDRFVPSTQPAFCADAHFLLASALASAWFTPAQRTLLCKWVRVAYTKMMEC